MGSVENDAQGTPARMAFIAAQIFALFLALLGIFWGFGAIFWMLFPGPSGEWAGAAPSLTLVVDLPAGILCLIVALAVKRGHPRIRRICIIAAIVTLCLPLIAGSIRWCGIR
jgi:hypothetical protein